VASPVIFSCFDRSAVYLGAMTSEGQYDLQTGEGLIACPRCDALYVEEELRDGETARCLRCDTVLAKPQAGAFVQIIALAIASIVLLMAAVFFPFLEISRMGFGNATSLFGVAMAFADGVMLPLVLAILGAVVGLPVFRALLLVYTLGPLSRGIAPHRHAATAFRWSEELRPWSMAEIFVIGTVVALVKIGGMAEVHLGPAFWSFCALLLVNFASHRYMSPATVWDALEDAGAPTDGREMVQARRP
jgi:paraquat-inducible protein A